jgi:2'-hydroxyisoflavone reductase
MALSRREFVLASAPLVTALAPIGTSARQALAATASQQRLRILILGGTGFIGPHQVRCALSRGHEITLFNRGRTNPGLFPQLETLIGDRNGDLEALRGRVWDAVIDNSATIPRWVRESTGLLKGSVKQYLFVSSTGVFYPYLATSIAENGPIDTIDDPTTETVNYETFGALKALSEEVTRAAFPEGHLVVRPTYIVGPGDTSDRFTYWPVRIDRGGEVLAPGEPTDPTQYIDVRDLSQFMIQLLEREESGTFNVVGQETELTIAELLYGIRAVTTSPVKFTWVDADFLVAHGVGELTFWEPPRGATLGMMRIAGSKAFRHGLRVRPLAQTAKDTLDWFQTLDYRRQSRLRSGLTPERERDLLAEYSRR